MSFLFSDTVKEKRGGFTGKLSEHKAEVILACLRDSCGNSINRNTAQNGKLSTNGGKANSEPLTSDVVAAGGVQDVADACCTLGWEAGVRGL